VVWINVDGNGLDLNNNGILDLVDLAGFGIILEEDFGILSLVDIG